MPKGKPKKGPATKPAPAKGTAVNKTEAVKRALADLGPDAKPVQIRDYIRSKFGFEMDLNLISNYKSILKKGAGKKAVTRQPPRPPLAAPVRNAVPAGGYSVDDIRAVQQLVSRLGADNVRELAAVLSR